MMSEDRAALLLLRKEVRVQGNGRGRALRLSAGGLGRYGAVEGATLTHGFLPIAGEPELVGCRWMGGTGGDIASICHGRCLHPEDHNSWGGVRV